MTIGHYTMDQKSFFKAHLSRLSAPTRGQSLGFSVASVLHPMWGCAEESDRPSRKRGGPGDQRGGQTASWKFSGARTKPSIIGA